MNSLRRHAHVATLCAAIGLLALVACGTLPETTAAPNLALPLGTPVGTIAQLPLATAPTRRSSTTDSQAAAATAEVVRANAQATLNSANATLGAAQTQDQNSANILAAQLASTAQIEAAHAQATLVAAGSTQSAALTQDAIRQTQEADLATTDAQAVVNQQNRDQLAASTGTAVAENIATQTQAAVATSQWFADQARLRDEQRQVPIAFLWTWCLPMFIVLLAGLILWGVWRWLRIRQNHQRILADTMEQLEAPAPHFVDHHPDESAPYIEGENVDGRYELTKPDDQVHRWLDEVKRKLRSSDQKDEDDTHN